MPRRPALAALTGTLGVLAALLVPGAAAPARAAALPAVCTDTSWVAGSLDLCDGRLVYRDYVYDDTGADSGDIGYTTNTSKAYGTLAAPAGDVRYPADDTNSADLVRLELRRSGGRVLVTAELGALRRPDSTVLALAVDTDGDATTGGGTWPGLAVRSSGWDEQYRLTTGDPATNTMTGSFPLPASGTWRVQAVTAQAATGQVMNVAYRGVDEHAAYRLVPNPASPYPYSGQGAWFEDDQAAALRDGDVSAFGAVVRTADLRPGRSRAQRVGPGLHERVYTSRHTLGEGEGMSYAGIPGRGDGGSASAFAQVFNFLGKYQPYGVYVPATAGPHGLQMEWHGSNQGIVAQINQPGMQAAYGDGLDRVLATPLARGPNGYGSDVSERDLLDVMDDVQRHYPVDRDRVFSSGYSQGGYITFRMAMLYPDRFAGFTSWVGFTGDDLNGTPVQGDVSVEAGAVGNMLRYVKNLRHVPGSMVYAGADELVQVPSARAMQQAFARSSDVYRWYLHPTAEHLTFAALDDWTKEAEDSRDQRLVHRPARVVFHTNSHLDAPEYGIRHDAAYWVSALRGRAPGDLVTDLTSRGCGTALPVTATGRSAGPSPVPWVSEERLRTGTRPQARAAVLEGSLVNVGSGRLDLSEACLTGAFRYAVTSDGPSVLRLSDGRVLRLVEGLNTGTLR